MFVDPMVGPQSVCYIRTKHMNEKQEFPAENILFASCLDFGTTFPPGSSVSGSRHENCHQRIQCAVSDSKHGDGRHQSEASGPADGALSEGRSHVRVEEHFTFTHCVVVPHTSAAVTVINEATCCFQVRGKSASSGAEDQG